MYIDDNFKDYAKQVCSCSPYQGQCHRACPHACCPSVTVGATLTGVPGSSARVTNSGTCCRPVLNFEIPRGNTGPAGATGAYIIGKQTTCKNAVPLNRVLMSIDLDIFSYSAVLIGEF